MKSNVSTIPGNARSNRCWYILALQIRAMYVLCDVHDVLRSVLRQSLMRMFSFALSGNAIVT